MTPSLTVLRPAERYSRTAPTLHGFETTDIEFRDYCLRIIGTLEVECPPQGYFDLHDVLVLEGKHVLLPDGEFLTDSVVDLNARAEVKAAILAARDRGFTVTLPTDGRLDVLFAKAGAGNYGHFLTDCAAKLVNLPRGVRGPVRLHLPNESARFRPIIEEFSARLGINTEIRVGSQGEVLCLSRALYLSSVAEHNVRKSRAFREFRQVVLGLHAPSPTATGQRLYVRRAKSEIRHIVNCEEVEALFTARGFRIVQPGTMSFGEQVRLFSGATHVAGGLGAGLVNIAWAAAGTSVLMIDPGLVDFYFWDISTQFGQRFFWHFAGDARRYTTRMELDPYFVEVATLGVTLDAMLSE